MNLSMNIQRSLFHIKYKQHISLQKVSIAQNIKPMILSLQDTVSIIM